MIKFITAFLYLLLATSALAQSPPPVKLSWMHSTDNVGVTGYNIYRDGKKIGSSPTTAYTDATVAATTQYSYTVSAFDAAGNESDTSMPYVIKTGTIIILPPTTGIEVPGVSAALFAAPVYTCLRNFYVNPAGGSPAGDNTRSTATAQNVSTPWATIDNYEAKIGSGNLGGDCINVGAGTYNVTTMNFTHGGSTSSATGYVVYRSTVLGGAVVRSSADGSPFTIGNGSTPGAYIMIDGFEVDGNSDTGLVCINSSIRSATAANHHIWVTNNNLHNCRQAGFTTVDGDWYWALHNHVHDNSASSGFSGSGISIYEPHQQPGYTPTAFDNQWSPYHIVINYNNSHDNLTDASNPFDGNGIALDDWSNHFNGANVNLGVPYTAPPGLIYGNVTYHNGGKGINSVYSTSNNTLIANNTAYNNNWSTLNTGTSRGEFYIEGGVGVLYKNNISYTVPGAGVLANNDPYGSDFASHPFGGVSIVLQTFTSNIAFGTGGTSWATTFVTDGDTFSCSTNKCNSDPLWVNKASNNFALGGSSPAIGYVTSLGLPSAVTAIPDAGACHHTLTTCP